MFNADNLTAEGSPVTLTPRQSSDVVMGYVALTGPSDVVVFYQDSQGYISPAAYDLGGNLLWSGSAVYSPGPRYGLQHFSVAAAGGYDYAVAFDTVGAGPTYSNTTVYGGTSTMFDSTGSRVSPYYYVDTSGVDVTAFSAPNGVHLEWNDVTADPNGGPTSYTFASAEQYTNGNSSGETTGTSGNAPQEIMPYAQTASGAVFIDNTAKTANGPTITNPYEPAHATTELAATDLTNGAQAVAWIDSGTLKFSLFDNGSYGFTRPQTLDWGGASDLHVLALAGNQFVLSWMKNGAYYGEVIDNTQSAGGIISLAGDVAGIDSHGNLYTVGLNSSGQEVVQTYAVTAAGSSSGGGGSGSTVYTSDANYTAPDGVTTIYLTGSKQTIHGNNGGDTIWSDDTPNTLVGGTGADTFHLGRAGDAVTGGGGNDTFAYATVPWGAGTITDFNAGDVLDLTGLLADEHYAGSDPIGAGYLKITSNSSGYAQVWANYEQSNNNTWWLVDTLNGVSASSLQLNDGLITVSSTPTPTPTAVSTSDSNYRAPANVNSITLTGSGQTVTANDHQDTTIWSDNSNGNTIHGGTADDVIHIGRAGDTVYGGAGRDVFVFDDIPWAPATIQDFDYASGDSIDVRGILAHAGYTGTDPVADGYLKIQNGEIQANYNKPGNDAWWVVAKGPAAPGGLVYDNGVIHGAYSHVGGTYTVSGNYNDGGGLGGGYDTLIQTGSNVSLAANDGGDTLIDNGVNNTMGDGRGNDTFILSPTTQEVFVGYGGLDTIVLNAHPQVATYDPYALNVGDRIDLHQLLNGMGYTGSDPLADGYVRVYSAPREQGQIYPNPIQIQFDSDGPSGGAAWQTAFSADGTSVTPHYNDGFLLF